CCLIRGRVQVRPLRPYTTLFRSEVLRGGREGGEGQQREDEAELQRHQPGAVVAEARAAEAVHERGPEDLDRPDDADGLQQAERRSEEHTSELQSRFELVCRLLLG